jgi:hypothetical protein
MTKSSLCKSSTPANRLQHSPEGEYNSLRMSSAQIFIYIEGVRDDIFYKSICKCSLKDIGVKYEVKYGGGKPRILSIFSYLESNGKLLPVFDNVKKTFFFFLDKDVDDLTNRLIGNEHINYTEYHSIENYYFIYGNLEESVTISIGLYTLSINSNTLKDNISWTRNAADKWKEWVELCLLGALKIPECENYSSNCSEIHKSSDGLVDQRLKANFEFRMQQKACIDNQEFRKIQTEICDLVNQIYSSGLHDSIFKGKWYCMFLCEDAEKIAQEHNVFKNRSKKHLEELLLSHLKRSLCYEDKWASHFILPLQKVAKKITN